jgi:hypothetical protein
MENKKFFGYKAAIGAFLVIFCNLGAASTLGVFLPSMSEYTGWSVAVLGYNGTFNTIGNVLLSLICVKALSKLGPKKLMFISIIGIFLNFQFYTFATDGQNVTSLVFIYLAGLMASFAIVFGTHAVCTYVISQWFVGEKRGKVISTVLSGASFGAAAWVFVAGQMFRVMNYKMCYQILSWVLLAVGLLSVIFLIRDPEKMGQKPMGTEVSDEVNAAQLPGVTRAEAIKSPSFWFFAIALLLGGCEGSAWLVYSPTWWTMNGLTPTEASNWNAIYTVLAGFVMLGVGGVFSKVGPTVFSVIVCIAFSLCMVFLIIFGVTPTTVILILTVICGALAYPLSASIPSIVGQAVFGPKEFGAISATLMTGVYLGQALYAPVMSACLATEGGFTTGWKVLCATGIATMVFLILSIKTSPMSKKVKA